MLKKILLVTLFISGVFGVDFVKEEQKAELVGPVNSYECNEDEESIVIVVKYNNGVKTTYIDKNTGDCYVVFQD